MAAQKQKGTATAAPAQGVLSPSNYNGDPSFYLVFNIWWGQNANSWTLSENGLQLGTYGLTDNSPNPQSGRSAVFTRPNGVYNYTAIANNPFGSTATTSYTITVRNGKPPSGPPAPPTGVTATPVNSNSIQVQWSAVSGATSYNIKVDANVISGVTSPYLANALQAGSPHSFAVQSVNASGAGAFSASVIATTPPAPTIPATPTGLTAGSITSNSASVSWNTVSDATAYDLLLDAVSLTGVTSPYLASGLAPSSSHSVQVRARNSAGSSSFSSTVVFTTSAGPTPPPVPTNVTATASSSTQLNVTWTASVGATSYQLLQDGVSISGVSSPYAAVGFAPSSTHTFQVRAVNSAGASAYSAVVSATTLAGGTIPPVPSGLTATAQSSSAIQVTWSASVGATSYSLKVDSAVVANAAPPYVVNSLAAGSTHTFAVAAVNGQGTSAYSATVSATTSSAAVPAVPTGLSVAINSAAQITIVWLGAAGATTYDLLKNGVVITSAHTPYVDNAVLPLTTYTYAVRGTNAAGSSAWSPSVSGTTPAGTTNPPLSVGQVVNSSLPYVLGYWPSWNTPFFNVATPDGTPMSDNAIWTAGGAFTQLPGIFSHVCLAFAQPNFSWSGLSANVWTGTGVEFPVPPSAILRVVNIFRQLGKKVILSVGGATYGNWTALGAEANKGGPITTALSAIVGQLGLDGLDVDFEANQDPSPASVALYANVITTIRAAVDASSGPGAKLLTIAAFSTGSDFTAAQAGQPGYTKPSYWGGAASRERLTFQTKITSGAYSGRTVGSLLDICSAMTYDAGFQFYSPETAVSQYQTLVPNTTPVMLGIEIAPQSWGSSVVTVEDSQTGPAGTIVLQDQYLNTINLPNSLDRYLKFQQGAANPKSGLFVWECTITTSQFAYSANANSFASKVAAFYGYVPRPPPSS
jgi:hypothetical protein